MNKLTNSSLGTQMLKKQFNSNQWLSWTVRIVLVIYAAFIATNLNKSMLNVFDNVIFRLLVAVVIIYLCYVDQASAILLAVGFVISIQTLNKYKLNMVTKEVVDKTMDDVPENADQMLPEGFEEESDPIADAMKTSDRLEAVLDATPIDQIHDADHSRLSPVQATTPAYGSMLDQQDEPMPNLESFQNPNEVIMKSKEGAFTSSVQLNDSQDNRVANNQMSQVQTWNNELGPQGLNQPLGFNISGCDLLENNSAKF
jgi:hypothetical protein